MANESNEEAEGSPPAARISVLASLAAKVSFATHQNAVPVLRDLQVLNEGDAPAEHLVVEISADPPVIASRRWPIDRIAARGAAHIADRDLTLNAGFLHDLTEAVRATVTLSVWPATDGAAPLAKQAHPVELLARTEWGGAGSMPELLAAMVQPNDPAVSRVLKTAAVVLRRAGRPDGLNGYESGDRTRPYELASAIWSAVCGLRLTYALPPASFETAGQKVRSPSAILEAGLATCLDTALLFAAALEQAGLNAVVVLTKGHAFVGVWLQRQQFASILMEDASALRKRVAMRDLVVFETTLATHTPAPGFGAAIIEGDRQIAEDREADFVLALDIARARMQRLRPLPSEVPEPASADPEAAATPAGEAFEAAPPLPAVDGDSLDVAPTTPEGRLERWRRKLLDLTARNRLLNVKAGSTALPLICPDVDRMEDMLAAGKVFTLAPLPQVDAGGRDAELHRARTGEVLEAEYARDALARSEMLVRLDAKKLDAQLTELYRKSRLDLAEGGANTLFLAIGALVWKKSPDDPRSYRAPLILQPVKLERKSVRSGVKLTLHEDEPRFNLTLLELLRQDFGLTELGAFGVGLPRDASGTDVSGVLAQVRRAVRDMQGFEVAEDVLLGTFSFAKYLMWKDLTDRADAIRASPVVRHLLDTPREPFDRDCEPPEPRDLDATVAPEELFAPLPADSSQLAAVIGSAQDCDFVLDGPPGTGKSQTIANMIIHNLAKGRRVLFVAEKRVALEVVRQRLEDHGLGTFCLELHSNKANKADVLGQLNRAWTTSAAASEAEWSRKAAALKGERDALNRYVALLHRRHANGMTLHQAIGRVVRDDRPGAPRLNWRTGLEHTDADLQQLHEAARRLDLNHAAARDLDPAAFGRIARTEWSNAWAADMVGAASTLASAASAAGSARANLLARLGVEAAAVGDDAVALSGLAELCDALLRSQGLDLSFVFAPTAAAAVEHGREALPILRGYQDEVAGLSVAYPTEPTRTLPLDALAASWTKASGSLWPLSVFGRQSVRKALTPAGSAVRADPASDLPRLTRMREQLVRLDALAAHASAVSAWAGVATDTVRFDRTLAVAAALRSGLSRAAATPVGAGQIRDAAANALVSGDDAVSPGAPLARAAQHYIDAYTALQAALAGFGALAEQVAADDEPRLLDRLERDGRIVADRQPALNAWTAWRRTEIEARDRGLGPLVEAMEAGAIPAGGAADVFEVAYARWWAEGVIDAEPLLRNFTTAEHADRIKRFKALEDDHARLTEAHVVALLSGKIPNKDARDQSRAYRALHQQIQTPRSRKRLREVIAETGEALTALAPCMLMSPLSVAQYLPADTPAFDVVIFDEASQITPWDAVGAMARGRHVVIAGDPRQMPPSRNFERGAAPSDDDSDAEEDLESILDEALSAGLPSRRLTWHYRSRSESLIAFSNHRYYGGELVTFPAPVTRESAVRLVSVAGSWARGAARTNQVEAESIVAEVLRRLADPAFVNERGERLSLGVVTMNAEQQKLIEDLLDKARRDDPELERFFGEDAGEPVVVKNLETVQGDERDLILLGVGYGPETPGAPTMHMNFGPLNRPGGWRRWNVAVTRARRELMLFASFPPHLIDLNRTAAAAVRDLKHYMEFAERGPRALGEAIAGSVGGFESPFEQAVASGLRDKGWTVVPQIGVSRFRIDLGVVHPDRPGDYLLGVECDGAAYHSAATARDRDKVREGVLTALGWTLLRVWSTDWWVDRAGALDRLHVRVDEALAADRQSRMASHPSTQN